MKALVVDDSIVRRKVLIGALSLAGINEVIQAGDGKEALEAVVQDDYDLVLLGWNIPNMPGIDVLKEIRSNGKTMPIIIVTTESEKSRVLEALNAGANSYIIKPFQPWAILAKIREVLGMPSS